MQTTKSYKAHYGLQWLLLGCCVAAWMAFHQSHVNLSSPFRPAPEKTAASSVNWFYMVKMPEITTQHESGVGTMKTRLIEWLETLKSHGFRPMLLSEALRRIYDGQGVPERTVVTFFNPSYRRTIEIVSPILAELKWPAVCLTDDTAM